MGVPNDRVKELQSKTKSELKDILGEELGDSYPREITNSLRNDFMLACYKEIGLEDPPFVKVQSHQNYSSTWSKKQQLATVLRMVLTDRVGHPEYDGITSLNKQVLAELIVAIRQTEAGPTGTQDADTSENKSPPSRGPLPECRFEDRLPAEAFFDYELYDWITDHRTSESGEHGVYVLDCTPPIDSEENSRINSLRAEVAEKLDAGDSLSKIERAAAAMNNNERLYYVGYAGDVPKRIREHVGGADSGGAKFTNIFHPQALVEISWFDDEGTARQYETQRADELTVPGKSFGYAE